MSNNITKQLYENIYRALGGDPNVQFETADDVWNAVTDIYDEGYDPVDLTPLDVLVTQNGTFEYTAPENDGYNKVTVNVDIPTGGVDFSLLRYDEAETINANNVFSDNIKYIAENIPEFIDESWLGIYDKGKMIFGPKVTFGNYTWGYPSIFQNETALIYVPQLDTSMLPNMPSFFEGCSNLTSIPQLDTSSATNMMSMFSGCSKLTTIPWMNTSNVTSMGGMFEGCSKLTTIPQLDTSNVVNMIDMFSHCDELISIPELDCSSCFNASGGMFNPTTPYDDSWGFAFGGYGKLTDLGGFLNFGLATDDTIGSRPDLDLSQLPALTHDSMMNVINKIANISEFNELKSLKFCRALRDVLTEDEIAIATEKGWNVSFN